MFYDYVFKRENSVMLVVKMDKKLLKCYLFYGSFFCTNAALEQYY